MPAAHQGEAEGEAGYRRGGEGERVREPREARGDPDRRGGDERQSESRQGSTHQRIAGSAPPSFGGAGAVKAYTSPPGRLPTVPSARNSMDSGNVTAGGTPTCPNIHSKANCVVPSPATVIGSCMTRVMTGMKPKYTIIGRGTSSARPR